MVVLEPWKGFQAGRPMLIISEFETQWLQLSEQNLA